MRISDHASKVLRAQCSLSRLSSAAVLQDKSSTATAMKIQALILLRLTLASSFAHAFEPHIKALSQPLLGVLTERYYKARPGCSLRSCHACAGLRLRWLAAVRLVKGGGALQVAAEGLRVAEELVRTMRPSPEQPVPKSLQVEQTC